MSSPDVQSGPTPLDRIATIPPQGGEPRWWFGGLAVIKLSSSQTEGRFSLIEAVLPPNVEVPLHVHTREDELFHMLDGKISYQVGPSHFEVSAGNTVFAPRNVPHRVRATSPEPARYLIVYSPAGFEEFIRETSEPAPGFVLPPPPEGPLDPAVLQRIGNLMAAKYGCHFAI